MSEGNKLSGLGLHLAEPETIEKRIKTIFD